MTEELRDSVEKRITNTLETITAEVFTNRIGIVGMCMERESVDFGDDVSNAFRSDVCFPCGGDVTRSDSFTGRNGE